MNGGFNCVETDSNYIVTTSGHPRVIHFAYLMVLTNLFMHMGGDTCVA